MATIVSCERQGEIYLGMWAFFLDCAFQTLIGWTGNSGHVVSSNSSAAQVAILTANKKSEKEANS